MVCGNALLRPNIREHSALIEKASAHRKSSRRISGKSESPHVRSGDVFQQTARPKNHTAFLGLYGKVRRHPPCAVAFLPRVSIKILAASPLEAVSGRGLRRKM